jgi:dTDP-4-amino-4,6-dideoxygalactose transaminase
LGYRRGDFPNAERIASEVLALPMYPELASQQQEYVVQTLIDFFRR